MEPDISIVGADGDLMTLSRPLKVDLLVYFRRITLPGLLYEHQLTRKNVCRLNKDLVCHETYFFSSMHVLLDSIHMSL